MIAVWSSGDPESLGAGAWFCVLLQAPPDNPRQTPMAAVQHHPRMKEG
jgi:hypothetical protein